MIETVFGYMTAVLLAKFMLNDVPHAILGQHAWVIRAWQELKTFACPFGLNLQEAYNKLVEYEAEYKVSYPAYINIESKFLPFFKRRIIDVRDFVSGYYLIANGEASDEVVNDMISILKRYEKPSRMLYQEVWSKPYEEAILKEGWGEKWLSIRRDIHAASTRLDRVLAIDRFIHFAHEGVERYAWALDEIFVLPESTFSGYIWEVFDRLSDTFTESTFKMTEEAGGKGEL